jgi:uncharacterized protein
MLLLAVQDHRDRIEVGYGLEPILPDGFDGSILRGIQSAVAQGAYGQAMIGRARRWFRHRPRQRRLARSPAHARASTVSTRRGLPWPVIVIGIIVCCCCFRGGGGGGGGFLTGMLLGNLLGGGRGGGVAGVAAASAAAAVEAEASAVLAEGIRAEAARRVVGRGQLVGRNSKSWKTNSWNSSIV